MGSEQWKHNISDALVDGLIPVAASCAMMSPATTEHVPDTIVDFTSLIAQTKGVYSRDSWLQRMPQHTGSLRETNVPQNVSYTGKSGYAGGWFGIDTWPPLVQ